LALKKEHFCEVFRAENRIFEKQLWLKLLALPDNVKFPEEFGRFAVKTRQFVA
jgi:hypothetical protein